MALYHESKILDFIFCFYFLVLSFVLSAQIENIKRPFVTNFGADQLSVGTVNDVDQSNNGLYYFATSSGLVETDGLTHRVYQKGKLTDLSAIYVQNDSVIFSGGYGGFGRWDKNEFGAFKYTSLYYVYPTSKNYLQPTFSGIETYNDEIVFQSQDFLYFFNPKTTSIRTLKAPSYYNNIYKTSKHLLAIDISGDVYNIEGDSLKLFQKNKGKQAMITTILETANNSFLFVYKNGELWLKKEDSFLLKKKFNSYTLNTAVFDVEEKLVIGTNLNGIYVLDHDFMIEKSIDDQDGLQSNFVRKLVTDKRGSIWVSNDKGIHYLPHNNEVSVINDSNRNGISFSYFLDKSKNELLKGTNQGLFVLDIQNNNNEFKLIENSQGVTWDIKKIDQTVFVGHANGIFRYEDNSLIPIHAINGAWNFKQHPLRKDLIFCGTYNGIILLKKTNNIWRFYKRLDGFWDSSRFMEFDKQSLWVCHPAKGFYKIDLSLDFEYLLSYEFYQNFDSSDSSFYNYFYKLNNELIFYNPTGFYKYDYTDNTFYISDKPTKLFNGINNLFSIQQMDQLLWFTTKNYIGYINLKNKEPTKVIQPFFYDRINNLRDFTKFIQLDEDHFIFNTDSKSLIYNHRNFKLKKYEKIIDPPIVKGIKFVGINDTIVHKTFDTNDVKVPHKNNSLTMDILIPYYLENSNLKLEYKVNMEGIWMNSKTNNGINLSGLNTNRYQLFIRLNDQEGNTSEEISYGFIIKPLWYFSSLAISLYIVLIFIVFIFTFIRIEIKNQKDKNRLVEGEKRKQKIKINDLELEKLKGEKLMLDLQQEKLQLQIENHNQELAFSTYTNIKKNDLLRNLKEHILQVNKVKSIESLNPSMKSIVKKINNELDGAYDWVKFEYHFKKANPHFFDSLQQAHPSLTSNDIRICAFIKLNLPTKQMASFLNINTKSLEMTRYRLRKKLNLEDRTDLYHYISTL